MGNNEKFVAHYTYMMGNIDTFSCSLHEYNGEYWQISCTFPLIWGE